MVIANMVKGNEGFSYTVTGANGGYNEGSLDARTFNSFTPSGNSPYTVEFQATVGATIKGVNSPDAVIFYNYDWDPPYKVTNPD